MLQLTCKTLPRYSTSCTRGFQMMPKKVRGRGRGEEGGRGTDKRKRTRPLHPSPVTCHRSPFLDQCLTHPYPSPLPPIGTPARHTDGFWEFVNEHSVSCKTVVAVLHYFMEGCDESPESAALAASVYLAMLQMPGSGTRKLQQPMVTRSVFTILEQWRQVLTRAQRQRDTHAQTERRACTDRETRTQRRARRHTPAVSGRHSFRSVFAAQSFSCFWLAVRQKPIHRRLCLCC